MITELEETNMMSDSFEDIFSTSPLRIDVVAFLRVKGVDYPVYGGTNLIGRDPANDITLSDKVISNFHARIDVDEGFHLLCDLGSQNETMLNKGTCDAQKLYNIEDQDCITFGDIPSVYTILNCSSNITGDRSRAVKEETAGTSNEVDRNLMDTQSLVDISTIENSQPYENSDWSVPETQPGKFRAVPELIVLDDSDSSNQGSFEIGSLSRATEAIILSDDSASETENNKEENEIKKPGLSMQVPQSPDLINKPSIHNGQEESPVGNESECHKTLRKSPSVSVKVIPCGFVSDIYNCTTQNIDAQTDSVNMQKDIFDAPTQLLDTPCEKYIDKFEKTSHESSDDVAHNPNAPPKVDDSFEGEYMNKIKKTCGDEEKVKQDHEGPSRVDDIFLAETQLLDDISLVGNTQVTTEIGHPLKKRLAPLKADSSDGAILGESSRNVQQYLEECYILDDASCIQDAKVKNEIGHRLKKKRISLKAETCESNYNSQRDPDETCMVDEGTSNMAVESCDDQNFNVQEELDDVLEEEHFFDSENSTSPIEHTKNPDGIFEANTQSLSDVPCSQHTKISDTKVHKMVTLDEGRSNVTDMNCAEASCNGQEELDILREEENYVSYAEHTRNPGGNGYIMNNKLFSVNSVDSAHEANDIFEAETQVVSNDNMPTIENVEIPIKTEPPKNLLFVLPADDADKVKKTCGDEESLEQKLSHNVEEIPLEANIIREISDESSLDIQQSHDRTNELVDIFEAETQVLSMDWPKIPGKSGHLVHKVKAIDLDVLNSRGESSLDVEENPDEASKTVDFFMANTQILSRKEESLTDHMQKKCVMSTISVENSNKIGKTDDDLSPSGEHETVGDDFFIAETQVLLEDEHSKIPGKLDQSINIELISKTNNEANHDSEQYPDQCKEVPSELHDNFFTTQTQVHLEDSILISGSKIKNTSRKEESSTDHMQKCVMSTGSVENSNKIGKTDDDSIESSSDPPGTAGNQLSIHVKKNSGASVKKVIDEHNDSLTDVIYDTNKANNVDGEITTKTKNETSYSLITPSSKSHKKKADTNVSASILTDVDTPSPSGYSIRGKRHSIPTWKIQDNLEQSFIKTYKKRKLENQDILGSSETVVGEVVHAEPQCEVSDHIPCESRRFETSKQLSADTVLELSKNDLSESKEYDKMDEHVEEASGSGINTEKLPSPTIKNKRGRSNNIDKLQSKRMKKASAESSQQERSKNGDTENLSSENTSSKTSRQWRSMSYVGQTSTSENASRKSCRRGRSNSSNRGTASKETNRQQKSKNSARQTSTSKSNNGISGGELINDKDLKGMDEKRKKKHDDNEQDVQQIKLLKRSGRLNQKQEQSLQQETEGVSLGTKRVYPHVPSLQVAKKLPQNPTQKGKGQMLKYTILFTGIPCTAHDTGVIKNLGGTVVDLPDECSVLITDQVRRTYKFLCAMALGKPIVNSQWLKESRSSGYFLDPWKYIIKDSESEQKYSFDLQTSLKKALEKKLLLRYSVLVTPSVKPPQEEIKVIIEACGGKVLNQIPGSRWPKNSFIISCKADEEYWPKVHKGKKPIVTVEALIRGILQQDLDLNAHVLT